jgi:uncharacterized protein YbjT (DUF2867 family)
MEQALSAIEIPMTFLRPGWFMENVLWDVSSARDSGILQTDLQPADKTFPMVATRDVGRLGARLLRQNWRGTRVVELEGPIRVSPNDIAEAFAQSVKRAVHVEAVPRTAWEDLFRSQGMRNPLPRMRMLDGFNEGWIEFRDRGRSAVKGSTPLVDVIASLIAGGKVSEPTEDKR